MGGDIDAFQADAALQFDAAWTDALQAQWLALMAIAVWDDVALSRLGSAPRLRKRVLELGERLRSLSASRAWIPHPRERLKSALAAALAVRETLQALDGLVPELAPGAGADRLRDALAALQVTAMTELPRRETVWAGLLDAQIGA
jgi:hypothetical protein